LPLPEDPLRDLQTKPSKCNFYLFNLTNRSFILATIVTVHDPYNFSTTRYHLEERLVTKEEDEQVISFFEDWQSS